MALTNTPSTNTHNQNDHKKIIIDNLVSPEEKQIIRDKFNTDKEKLIAETKGGLFKEFINKDLRIASEVTANELSYIQKGLNIGADGVYGPASFRNIIKFQKQHGLALNGIATREVLTKIALIDVQKKLGTPHDGIMGPNTRGLINSYQESNGLEVTGTVTNELVNKLNGKEILVNTSVTKSDVFSNIESTPIVAEVSSDIMEPEEFDAAAKKYTQEQKERAESPKEQKKRTKGEEKEATEPKKTKPKQELTAKNILKKGKQEQLTGIEKRRLEIFERKINKLKEKYSGLNLTDIFEGKQIPTKMELQSIKEMINEIHKLGNRSIKYTPDYKIDKSGEHVTTGYIAVKNHRGDCEEYAILKRVMLKEIGIPEEYLNLTYGQKNNPKTGKKISAHMVLSVKLPFDNDVTVLDNTYSKIYSMGSYYQKNNFISQYSIDSTSVYNNKGVRMGGNVPQKYAQAIQNEQLFA